MLALREGDQQPRGLSSRETVQTKPWEQDLCTLGGDACLSGSKHVGRSQREGVWGGALEMGRALTGGCSSSASSSRRHRAGSGAH